MPNAYFQQVRTVLLKIPQVMKVQVVPGIDPYADFVGDLCRFSVGLDSRQGVFIKRMGKRSRIKFHPVGAGEFGALHHSRIRINKN